jgi:hypothetical protein
MNPIQLQPRQRKFIEKYLEYYISNMIPDLHADTLDRILLENQYYPQQRPVLNEMRKEGLVEHKQKYDQQMYEIKKMML